MSREKKMDNSAIYEITRISDALKSVGVYRYFGTLSGAAAEKD